MWKSVLPNRADPLHWLRCARSFAFFFELQSQGAPRGLWLRDLAAPLRALDAMRLGALRDRSRVVPHLSCWSVGPCTGHLLRVLGWPVRLMGVQVLRRLLSV